MKTSNTRRTRRGQALVEMSLVVIILLFLTLGLIQYGLLASARVSLTNVARDGARYAALNATKPTTQLQDYVIAEANTTPLGTLTRSDITITALQGRTAGNPINVTVSYDLRRKFILPGTFPGLSRFVNRTTDSAEMLIQQ